MADDFSAQLLGFNFASRTFAYNCLVEGLNKSVTGFGTFVKHYLDRCLVANVCKHVVDDTAAGVKNFDEMIPALRKFSDCRRESGLKISAHRCKYWTTKIDYSGSRITPQGNSHESANIKNLLRQIRMPNTVKRLIGFVQFFRNFIPNLGRK